MPFDYPLWYGTIAWGPFTPWLVTYVRPYLVDIILSRILVPWYAIAPHYNGAILLVEPNGTGWSDVPPPWVYLVAQDDAIALARGAIAEQSAPYDPSTPLSSGSFAEQWRTSTPADFPVWRTIP